MRRISWKFWRWRPFQFHEVTGGQPCWWYAEGDDKASPTRWWNHWINVTFGWQKIAVLEVPDKAVRYGYMVGYQPIDRHGRSGQAMIFEELLTDRQFAVLLGYEDCDFFIVIPHTGTSPALTLVRYSYGRHQPRHWNMPLI